MERLHVLSSVSPTKAKVPLGEQLGPAQRQELMELVDRNQDMFSKLRPYRIPEARRDAVRTEVKTMLEAGVIEELNSEWCSPIVLVPKPDGTMLL